MFDRDRLFRKTWNILKLFSFHFFWDGCHEFGFIVATYRHKKSSFGGCAACSFVGVMQLPFNFPINHELVSNQSLMCQFHDATVRGKLDQHGIYMRGLLLWNYELTQLNRRDDENDGKFAFIEDLNLNNSVPAIDSSIIAEYRSIDTVRWLEAMNCRSIKAWF